MTRLDAVREILNGAEISDFAKGWIEGNRGISEESIRESYDVLKGYGLSDKKASTYAHLLGIMPEDLRSRHRKLKELGMSDENILNNPSILSKSPEKMESNHRKLTELGLSREAIASNSYLIGANPETVETNYNSLKDLGVKCRENDNKFLLARKPGVLKRNHEGIGRLIFGHELVTRNPSVLNFDPEAIERNYVILKGYGVSDRKMIRHTRLLTTNHADLQTNYEMLKGWGIKDSKIVTHPELLLIDADDLKDRHSYLKGLGISDKKLANQAALLGKDEGSMKKDYDVLRKIGVKRKEIAKRAELLSMSPKTIMRYYQSHVGLLRDDYKDRESGRGILADNALLLETPPETLESNFHYLNRLGISQRNTNPISYSMMLATRSQTKRQKVAWMLREIFDYREAGADERKSIIGDAYRLVSDRPRYLIASIDTLDSEKKGLRKRARSYRK